MSTRYRPPKVVAVLCAAGLWLSGCGTEDQTSPQPSPDTPEQASPSIESTNDQPTATPKDPTDEHSPQTTTEPVDEFSTENQHSAGWPEYGDTSNIYPTAVRAAVHDGFERIVIEHAGTGQPSFFTQYTAEPREPGIGTLVDTGSEAYLEVTLSGTTNPLDLPPDMLEHGAHIEDLDTQATEVVVSFAPWEATSTYYLGLDQQRPYAVSVLDSPVRVVIDIQLEGQ